MKTKNYPNLEIPAKEMISWPENITHTSFQVAKQEVNTREAYIGPIPSTQERIYNFTNLLVKAYICFPPKK